MNHAGLPGHQPAHVGVGGDPEQLSVSSVLSLFAEMERRYGSLTRGVLAARRRAMAVEAFQTALSIDPEHAGAQAQLDRLGRRKRPGVHERSAAPHRPEHSGQGWQPNSSGRSRTASAAAEHAEDVEH